MEQQKHIQTLVGEIEGLARMHIVYGQINTDAFQKKQRQIRKMMLEHHINWRNDLDPITRNLYRRYFD